MLTIRYIKLLIWSTFILLVLTGCGGGGTDTTSALSNAPAQQNQSAPVFGFQVVQTLPHQTNAFTQGLVIEQGRLFESTGLIGQSSLREINLATGATIRSRALANNVFGEGLAVRAGELYQLTLNSGIAQVSNLNTLAAIGTRTTRNPAWGLAYLPSSDQFAFSDGTAVIRFLQPGNFQEIRSVTVTDNGQAVDRLNELELVGNLLYANRFLTDEIIVINPASGEVSFRLDLSGIIDKQANNLGLNDVLNGIAWDAAQDRLYVTGKRWPSLFEITRGARIR